MPEMVDTAHCYNCFSQRQLLQIVVATIATYAVDHARITNLDQEIEDVVCMNCLEPRQIHGMLVDQIQIGINNGTLFNPS